jgi:hypothetical protein
MSTITVNKIDTNDDASEFDIETLDDIQSGGATDDKQSSVPTLSVPMNTTSTTANEKLNSLQKVNNTSPSATVKTNSNANANEKANTISTLNANVKANTTANESIKESKDENEKNVTVEGNVTSKNTKEEAIEEESEFPAENEEKDENNNNKEPSNKEPNTIPQPQTKKKGKKKGKAVGLTKKKVVVKPKEEEPVINNVQPHVEFGNDRGTMTIKYSSAKNMVPLYTTAKSSHLDLSAIKMAFETEYETVKAMSTEQMVELRRDMLNTEFTELGSESLIYGLLSLIDDHDTKKLTLKMMLARGILKVKP